MNKQSNPTCYQCNSELILVSQITEKIGDSLFPQTTTIYRCSNQTCQDEKDKQEEKRIKFAQEREKANKKRIEDNIAKKLQKKTEKDQTLKEKKK